MEKKDYFELHPSLKPLRFNDVFKYIVQREIDEDKIGILSKSGNAYHFTRDSFRGDEFDKLMKKHAPNYSASYLTLVIDKDKFLNSKDIPWSIPNIRNYNHRYAWCAIINNAPFEIDGRVLVMNTLPALIHFVKALGLGLDGVTAIDKWAVWEHNPLAYKVYSPFCIWDNFVLEGIEFNEEDKKLLLELKEDIGIASNECSEIRVFNPVTRTHPVESVYNIACESIYGPSIIGALLFGYLDKVDELGKDLAELINENRENIDLLYKTHRYKNGGVMGSILSIHHYLSSCKGPFPIEATINDKGKAFLRCEFPDIEHPVIVKEDIEKDLDLTGIDYNECKLDPLGQSLLNPKLEEFLLITDGVYTDEDKTVWLKVPCAFTLEGDSTSSLSSRFIAYHSDSRLVTMRKDGGLLYSGIYMWKIDDLLSRLQPNPRDDVKVLFDSGKVKGPYLDNKGSVYVLYRMSQPEVV